MENKYTVLIVDGDAGLTSKIQGVLDAEGYNTAVAGDGQTALVLYKESVPDLVLVGTGRLDMSWQELIRQLEKISPGAWYIIITESVSLDGVIDAVGDAKIMGYLTRPLDMKYLSFLVKWAAACRQMEASLRESEAKFRSIVGNSNDQIFLMDQDCKFLFINKAAADVAGKSPHEMLGMSIFEIFPEETAARFSKNVKKYFVTARV